MGCRIAIRRRIFRYNCMHFSCFMLHTEITYYLTPQSSLCIQKRITDSCNFHQIHVFVWILITLHARNISSSSSCCHWQFQELSRPIPCYLSPFQFNRENLNFGSPGRQTKNYLKLFPDLLWGEQSFAYKSSLFHCPVITLNHWSAFVCQLHRYNYNPLDPLQRMMDDTVRLFLSQGKPLDLLVELLEIYFVFERFIIPTVDGGCRWGMLRCDFSTFKF